MKRPEDIELVERSDISAIKEEIDKAAVKAIADGWLSSIEGCIEVSRRYNGVTFKVAEEYCAVNGWRLTNCVRKSGETTVLTLVSLKKHKKQ